MKPTEKQLSFINHICEVLEIETPNCETKEQAKDFISNHIQEYKQQAIWKFYCWENEVLNG